MASGYNTGLPKKKWPRSWLSKAAPSIKQVGIPYMSKEHIQEVVKKSLEKYFRDLGEQRPSNVYEMVVLTVEKPILEAVMERAQGNQSHAAEMLGINRNTLRKKLQQHGLI
jgi:Fis family transcriptional regulator, factor for inversion stimulation protein